MITDGPLQWGQVNAEGHDLDVLRDAPSLLARQVIDLIEFEITASNIYTNVHFYQGRTARATRQSLPAHW